MTKVYRPPPRPDMVSRPQLVRRLDEGLHRKLTLVSAPAGFGKTTIVSSWLAGSDRPAAWLSLDAGDNDPARFLTYLVATLQSVAKNIGAVAGALRSPQSPPSDAVLTTLLNEIAAAPDAFTVVLDDYHVIDSEAVDQAVTFLLEHAPPQMHLVITTREDPRLPLARLRAGGQLTELRAADLRFDSTETAAFLADVMGLELQAPDVALLGARTEGWVAGLQLAATALQGHADAAGFVASFSGSNRFVLDYLVEEVLQQQSPDVRLFLLQTAILDRMSGPLCDAVLGNPAGSSERLLAEIDKANLFIVPLDDERRWYRYHHLFAELLRQQREQAVGGEAARVSVAELHGRASHWFEDNGLALEAFQHAAAAADLDRAEALIEGGGVPLHFRGAAAPVLAWLDSLPSAVMEARPSLCVTYASAATFSGQTTGVEEKLQAAEAAVAATGPDQNRDLLGRIATLRATLAVVHNDVGAIFSQARRALEYLDPANVTLRTAAAWALGHAHQLAGDRAEARKSYAEALAHVRSPTDSIYTLAAAITSGHLQASDNELSLAKRTYMLALELAGEPPHPMSAEAHLGLARICYQRNDLEAAASHGQRCALLLRLMEKVPTAATYHLFTARLELAQGDANSAAAAIEEAAAYVHEKGFDFQLPDIAALQVVRLLRQGETAAAEQMAETYDLPLSRARVHLALGEAAAALADLGPWRQQVEERGWADDLLKVKVLQSLAHHANGDEDAAARELDAALSLAEAGGFVRIFLDEGAPMAALLTNAAARGTSPTYVARLLTAFAAEPGQGQTGAIRDQAVAGPLSRREIEVLRLIAQGLSNQEISTQLFRALDTVKGHSRSIYAKLEVNSRTEAVARARELGLL